MVKTVEETYQKKTPKEHILLRPDTYIGSVEMDRQLMFVWSEQDKKIVQKQISFVPGLYKIFDEILVNAADNKQRDKNMSCIKVEITDTTISVLNDGRGIPIEVHKKEKVYVPELIFGHLLTSSNYDDNEKKITGGRNGYGAKLCNIFSKEFIVETANGGQKYVQKFKNNMSEIETPKISVYSKKDYTKITFTPDFERFKMEKLDDDIKSLLKKRVYDMCASVRRIKVVLNDEKLDVPTLKAYAGLYLPDTVEMVHKVINDRWELVCAVAEDQFTQVSFVNSICTSKGGTHVNHVIDQLMEPLSAAVKRKDKNLILKPLNIKNSIFIFINCLIENPAFDSQTKENLTLKISKFGSKCIPIDDFAKEIVKKTPIVERIVNFSRAKQASLLKKTDGTKTTKITGIPKLEDANYAGTKRSNDCTLILTEGDSAKTLAVAGLGVIGRDKYGVFPLRGKLLNVREANHTQIMENAEINAIKKIVGLQHGKVYTSTESLRYGHIMIMTDQDHDGSHIKGLIINFFDHFFPSLLKVDGFLKEFITPIVRATKKKVKKDFFTIPEYETFKTDLEARNETGWTIKYYKGLGTSTTADAKQYFSNLDLHVKNFIAANNEDSQNIDLAFNRKKADQRKSWLGEFAIGTYLDQSGNNISITDFVNRELILFSMADNIRSIPSVIDGFKPGQRKVIFSCFKRNLRTEIKVAQLVGYVSEHSAYHHGEASLASTIINLAHDFVGSNNINLLLPLGQFGSRLLGGKDSASPRYIFTNLNPLCRRIFHEFDDSILMYQTEDNMKIEPQWYVPIIPMVLVNGAEGIGTGWSTNIPNYNPLDLIENIKRLLNGQEMYEIQPFYRNWKGKMISAGKDKFYVLGLANELKAENKMNVLELPVGVWTQSYKEHLDSCIQKGTVKNYKDYTTDKNVDLVIDYTHGFNEKLVSSLTTSNMVCFDSKGKIRKYSSPLEIIREFYGVRLEYYKIRKENRLSTILHDLTKLKNKVQFIKEVSSGILIVSRRPVADLISELESKGYDRFDDYEYLLGMKISSLTKERMERLQAEHENKQQEYDELKEKTPKDLWLIDLEVFESDYIKMVKEESQEYLKEQKRKPKLPPVIGEKDLMSKKLKEKRVSKKMTEIGITKTKLQKPKKQKISSPKTETTKKMQNLSIKVDKAPKDDFIVSDSEEEMPWKKYKEL
ncbi:top2 [Nucleospora cyclopteri]